MNKQKEGKSTRKPLKCPCCKKNLCSIGFDEFIIGGSLDYSVNIGKYVACIEFDIQNLEDAQCPHCGTSFDDDARALEN